MQTVPLTAQTYTLPEGDAGTAFTIQAMAEQIERGKVSPAIRACALEILNAAHVRPFDFPGAARAIYNWVLRSITFTPDPVGKEAIQTAEWTLAYRRGDCDCISVLMCALLESVGLRCRLMTVASDARVPEQFSHVYPQVLLAGEWVSVDAARRSPAFGRSPSRYFRRRAWSVHSGESRELGMSGLGILTPPLHTATMATRARAAGYPLYYNPPPPPRRYYNRRARLRGLGQDWSEIGQAIQAGTAGAANIIAATRATPYNLVPTTYVPASGAAAGPQIRLTPPIPSTTGFFGLTTGELIFGALLLGMGVVALRK